MIEITIRLRSARTGRTTLLGRATISNTGEYTAHERRHNYLFSLKRKPGFKSTTRQATVKNWPRTSKTVWQLLQACLNEAYPQPRRRNDNTRTPD